MFSSLPSASKIYVSSTKSKQKSSSAKKRRKKVTNHVIFPNEVTENDTLISSSNEVSACDISPEKFKIVNEDQNVCFSDKTSSLGERCEEPVGVLTNGKNLLYDIPKKKSEDNENEDISSSLTTYSSAECKIKQPVAEIFQSSSLSAETKLAYILEPDINLSETESLPSSDKTDFILNEEKADLVNNINIETVKNAVACSTTQTDSVFMGNNDETYEDVNDCFLNEDSPSEEASLDVLVDNVENFTFSTCEENETIQENLSNTGKWQEKVNIHEKEIEYDNASIKSDCCMAVNIYDEHDTNALENQDYSESVDDTVFENKFKGTHSPEQSEGSGTESAIGDMKSTCPPILGVTREKIVENISDSVLNKVPEILSETKSGACLDISKSFSDLKGNSYKTHLKRSSLPDKINFFNHGYDPVSTTNQNPMSDKSTMTNDVQVPCDNCKNNLETTRVIKIQNEDKLHSKTKSVSVSAGDVTSYFMKVLPPVAMLQARARSYVFGSIGTAGSLLGNEELTRYFPNNKVTIFVGTWNMNGHDPPKNIDDFLLPLDVSTLPDIYAIGVQESMQSRSEWEILLQTTLGPSHVLFTASSFGTLYLSIFLRRDLIWFCSEPEEASVATRPASMVKTKGAIAICFRFFGTSFLFLNSHLTAHEQKLKERLSDYDKICSSLDLPKLIPLKSHGKTRDVTSRFDYVFWCGDLNFRVVQDRKSVLSFVEEKIQRPQPLCNILMKHDQLFNEMAKGTAFQGFKEGVINFIPSYKFDVGTSDFDSSKMRVPSYTDRILYRCKETSAATCLHYNAVSDIVSSDHKPVYAIFEATIKPGRDNVPMAAGMFKRDVYLEAIKRRAKALDVHDQKQSTICNVM